MRKAFIGIGVFLVLVIVGVLIFVATFDVNRYRRTIESELEGRLGRRVTLGDMHLNLFPPRFRVENAVIGDDLSFRSGAPFIKAQSLDVSVQLMPLLHKQVEVDSLTLQRPSVNLIKNSAGVWNFASLGHPAGAQTNPPPAPGGKKPAPSAPPSSPAPGDQGFSLAELNIRDGQLTVLDQQRERKASIYDHIDITLKNFAPDRPFQLDAGLHLPGSGQQQARLTGEGGPVVRDQPAATPFDGTLSLKQVTIGDLAKFLDSPALNGTDGVVSGDIKIK